MWKVEFTKDKNTITLYVAEDALVYCHNLLSTQELQQYFPDQLGKLAFQLERIIHGSLDTKKPHHSTVYIRSCFANDPKIADLICHYQVLTNNAAKDKATLAFVSLKNLGKNYTNNLSPAIVTRVESAEAESKFETFDMDPWVSKLGQDAPVSAELPSYRSIDQLEPDSRNLETYIKTNITIALYRSALEYYRFIWKEYRENIKALTEQTLLFNKKFAGILKINANFSVTPLEDALQKMLPLPLRSQDGENFEDSTNTYLLHAADVIGDALLQNYGTAFEIFKAHLNKANEFCRFNFTDNSRCELFFEPVSKPTDNNVGIVTNHVPIVRNAMSLIANTTKAVLENTVKNKRREFVLNPWVFDATMQQKFIASYAEQKGKSANNSNNDPNPKPLSAPFITAESPDNDSNGHTGDTIKEKSLSELLEDIDDEEPEHRYIPVQQQPAAPKPKPGFFSSIMLKRVLVGAAIGLAAAAVAATIVSLMLFSGGTIVAPVVAAGMVLAIGGTGPAIATIIGGVLLTTLIGAGIAALFNLGSRKQKLNTVEIMENPPVRRPTPVTSRKKEVVDESGLSDHSMFNEHSPPAQIKRADSRTTFKQRK